MKPANWPKALPYIDPAVEWLGITFMRSFNVKKLGTLSKAIVFHDNGKALAVLLPYETFLQMQAVEPPAATGTGER